MERVEGLKVVVVAVVAGTQAEHARVRYTLRNEEPKRCAPEDPENAVRYGLHCRYKGEGVVSAVDLHRVQYWCKDNAWKERVGSCERGVVGSTCCKDTPAKGVE